MKKLFLAFSLIWGFCLAQGATRPLLLTWGPSPSTGVTGYNVYRSTTTGTGYVKIGSVAAGPTNTFTDAPTVGTTYFYVVSATGPACTPTSSSACGESPFSQEASITIPGRPQAPGTIVLVVP